MHARRRKFLSYYRPYLGLFLADMACAFVVAAVALILPLCARYITKDILAGNGPDSAQKILAMGALMLILAAIHTACNMFVDYKGHMMGAMMEGDMRDELFDHYQTLSFSFYDEQKTGQLMSRITNDLFSLAEFYHHGPEDLIIALLTIVGVFGISITINPHLTVIVFLFIPIMAVYAFYFHRKMIVATGRSRERIADINSQVEDTLSGIRVVKSFTNEDVEKQKFTRENERFLESRSYGYRSEALFSAGLIGFTQLITIAVIIFGGLSIANRSLDLPDLLTYLLYVGILIEPVQRLVNFARLYQEGITGFSRYVEMLQMRPEIRDRVGAIERVELHGNIDFSNVCFRYRDDREYVLENISLKIGAGEFIAFVGTSGVGKTTLCSLIPRFYEVTSGSISIDGNDIRDISLRTLRRNIGIVHQDVYLFAGTVSENIRYGKPEASEEEVIAAARMANAHEFIINLPLGYHTDVGQRGVKLSGGQKQRLSIARVFLKDPPIIIFDEATSALDNMSERAIQDSLQRLADNRTMLVIAHRLSTVRHARRIIVLSDRGVVEQGSHQELIARDGAYAQLYRLQLEI